MWVVVERVGLAGAPRPSHGRKCSVARLQQVHTLHEGALVAYPGGMPSGGEDFKSKRPVEAEKSNLAGIVACNKKNLTMQVRSQSNGTGSSENHAPLPP